MPGAGPRALVTYGLGVGAGALLFFLVFAAMFVGSWTFLVSFLLGYGAAGALQVRAGGVTPGAAALSLAAPAVPWVLWLFPASAAESGLLRAALWPGVAALAGTLAWLGAWLTFIRRTGRASERRVA